MSNDNIMRSAKKVPLPPHQEIWYIEYCAEYGRTAWVRRGWKQMFPILDKPQWYARVVLAESIPIDKYAAYVRIDWIEGFRGDYHNWDKKKIYRCYISRDLSEDPVFTIQYRKTHLQPYPAIYSVLVKQIFLRPDEAMSEDKSINDNASVYSQRSNTAASDDEGSEESLSPTEKYEEKLIQALENATEKSSQTRVIALQAIAEILSHRFLPDFFEDRKVTVMDVLGKSIRRGKGAEQSIAAQIVSILALQLGGGDEVAKELGPLLLVTAQNQSNGLDVRAKCCSGLGLLNFLGNEDIEDIVQLMQYLESIFSGSYVKSDKMPYIISADASALHCAALSVWGLLLTLIPSGYFYNMFEKNTFAPSMTNLIGMLQSQHLDVRTTAGEVIALVLESGRNHNEDFQNAYLTELIDTTKQLATDSSKYRAKRDRKTQRATFRDVLRYLDEDESPEIYIRFGTESLELDTWAIHHQYTALCAILGPGMTSHLAENDFLRDVLQLEPKVVQPAGAAVNKQSKLERQLLNAAAFKARTLSRSCNRDKRSAVFA